MKKRTLALIILLVAFLLWILLCLFHPLIGMKLFYWSYEEGDAFSLEDYKTMYYDHPEEYQLIRDDFSFQSQNITDYCTIVVGAQARNISPFHVNQIELTVDWKDPTSDVIFVTPSSIVSSAYCSRFSKLEERFITSFLVYRYGKTDEEIVDYLKNADVLLTYGTSIKSFSKRMKMGDFSYQVMANFDDYPNGWNVPVNEIPEGAEIIE